MRYAGMNWTVESDGLYGVYVRADRMDLVLAEAIERWLDPPIFPPELTRVIRKWQAIVDKRV